MATKKRSAKSDEIAGRQRYVDQPGQWRDITPKAIKKKQNKAWKDLEKKVAKRKSK